MSNWWVSDVLSSPGGTVVLISWVVWVVGSIVLHELGHGWAALACGDDTPRASGHMTWNPLVHMGWPSLVVFALIGLAWGAMPVNPARFRGRHDEAIVALAGPMMNVALAAGALVAKVVWIAAAGGHWLPVAVSDTLYANVQTFLRVGVTLNLVLAMFNLVPAPPLDGWRVVSAFVPAYRQVFLTPMGSIIGIVVIVLLLARGGGVIFDVARRADDRSTVALVRVLAPGALGGGPGGTSAGPPPASAP